ncbi:hypothetical protein ACFOD9_13650 [Novosphingobium bradum]|uniref:DUF2029 domain-containing protein n=1 Tax=Novosphingobium bradum TaxID=1737444 RepID=A0ABV7IVM9_9SPHN
MRGLPAMADADGVQNESDPVGTLRRATLATLLLLVSTALGALLIFPSPRYPGNLLYLTELCARRQDIPVALGLAGLFVASGLLRAHPPAARAMAEASGRRVAILVAGLVLGAWAIRVLVLFDHDFTRDEQMASFDAAIYGAGHLFWRLPEAVRPLYAPLNDLFLFPVPDHSAWVSNYLPVNAAIRAMLGKVIPPALVSPLLTGMAGLLLWRVARRIWPDDRATQAVVLLCLAGSSQVVLTGTATFAMTTHLALNLLWLACFLRGTRAGHAGAMITGLLATGIHQPVFHPLFVLPFLDLLHRRRQWRLLAGYIAAYAAIGAFWLAWPHWITAAIASGPGPGALAGPTGLVDRLFALVAIAPNLDALWVMAGNLLRFCTWQHALLVPLALVGARKLAGTDDLARALAGGVVLTVAAMTILLPPQGHGWGYRYLHGLIGSCCLLAGYGWRWLAARGAAPVRAFQAATLVSLVVLLPLHALMVRGFIAPFAEARQAVARTDADFVVFESGRIPFDHNFVSNRPDLGNRPLVLAGDVITPDGLAALCPRHSLAFADASEFAELSRYYEDPPRIGPGPAQIALRRAATKAGCRIVPFGRAD